MNGGWFERWQALRLLGQPLPDLLLASGAALLAWLLMSLGLRVARQRLARLAAHTRTRADDALLEVLQSTQPWLLGLAALLIGAGLLDLPDRWQARVGQLWFLAVAAQLGLWLNRLIGILIRRHFAKPLAAAEPGAPPPAVSAAATLLSWGLRTLLWAVVLLGMLSNLGINITAFIASLGVGGIAVALAAQNILSDLFASLSIAIDKPFEVGDFVVLGAVAGTVEHVGVKTTRIRSLGGEQVVMGNTELLKQTISNYKRLQRRRIVFGFGVDYDTPHEQLAEIPRLVQDAVQASARLRFDRAHFKGFGESSLDFEVVYIVLDAEYNVYMDEQQRINLNLMCALSERGVGFAYPTRVVRVVAAEPAPVSGRPEPGAAGASAA